LLDGIKEVKQSDNKFKEITATEYEYNEHGDIILQRDWYINGTYTEKKVFVPASKVKEHEKEKR